MRVAIIDPHEIVVAGLHMLIGQFADRVELIDCPGDPAVEVILYGVDDEESASHDAQLHALLRNTSATVVAFGWNPSGPKALVAAACGVRDFVPEQLAADPLIRRLEDLRPNRNRARASGHQSSLLGDCDCHPAVADAGLTSRELEVLTLIARGRSNAEIATDLFVSVNTVKTYIRTAYRKIGVQRRAQAVCWALRHGLGTPPDEAALTAVMTRQSGA